MSKEKTKKQTPTPVVEPQGTLADAANETTEQSMAELTQLREDLEQREQAISEKETTLNEKEAELSQLEQTLNEKEIELEEREKSLEEKEKSLEQSLESSENGTTEVSDDEPVKFSFEAEEYAFVKDAPKLIRVFGRVMSQKQIAQDEDIILQLVVGKSNLIEKV